MIEVDGVIEAAPMKGTITPQCLGVHVAEVWDSRWISAYGSASMPCNWSLGVLGAATDGRAGGALLLQPDAHQGASGLWHHDLSSWLILDEKICSFRTPCDC